MTQFEDVVENEAEALLWRYITMRGTAKQLGGEDCWKDPDEAWVENVLHYFRAKDKG